MRTFPQNYNLTGGSLMESFNNGSSWQTFGCSVGVVNTNTHNGTTSSLAVYGQYNTNGLITRKLTSPFVLNTINQFGWWINLIDDNNTTNHWLEFSPDGFASKSVTKSFGGSQYYNGDNFLVVNRNDWTYNNGCTSTDVMTHIRFRIGSGSSNAIVYLNGLYNNFYSYPKFIFVWDDNLDTQYSVSYPKMANYGFLASIGVVRDFVEGVNGPNYMSKSQLTDIQNNGHWDLLNHTYNHFNMSTLSESDQEWQLSNNRAYMQGNGWTSAINFVVLPQGGHDSDTPTALTNQAIVACRDGRVGYQHVNKGIDQPQLLQQVEMSNLVTDVEINNYIDNAITYGSALMITGHILRDTGSSSAIAFGATQYDSVLAHIASKGNGVEVLKFKEWFQGLNIPRKQLYINRSVVLNRNSVTRVAA